MDAEEKSAKNAKKVFIFILIAVVFAIGAGIFQLSMWVSSSGAEKAQEKVIIDQQEEADQKEDVPIDESEVGGSDTEYTGPANLDEGDDGIVGGTNTFDFGIKEDLPVEVSSPEGASRQVIDSTYSVESQIGLKAKPVGDITECSYYSKGYVACPIGGPYVQIIDSFYYQPFAYAKQGEPLPQNVINNFRKVHPDAIEGTGEGDFEGYYVVSRGIAQDLAVE